MHLLHRSNDTGHWRGSNDLLKIPVRNWLRPLAAEIVSGDSPSGGILAERLRFQFLTLTLYTIHLKKSSRKIPT